MLQLPFWILAILASSTLAFPPRADAQGHAEISQTCVQDGCFPGDDPGFPVQITRPGIYVLLENISVDTRLLSGILGTADHVSLDLRGFIVDYGPGCDAGPCTLETGNGIELAGRFCSIENGVVRGAGADGIRIGQDGVVREVSVIGSGRDGIFAGVDSMVLQSRASENGRHGISAGGGAETGTLFSQNVATANGRRGIGDDMSGGNRVVGNVCLDRSCARALRQRYYLSKVTVAGNEARTPCVEGYHMASLFEIVDPSGLEYDRQLGSSLAGGDADGGVTAGVFGWLRTALSSAHAKGGPGLSNCNAWTSADGTESGTAAALRSNWAESAASMTGLWEAEERPCDRPLQVWCVQN